MDSSHVYLVLDVGLLRSVKVHLQHPSAVELDTYPFPDHLSGIDQVVEEGFVDGRQRATKEEIQENEGRMDRMDACRLRTRVNQI